MENQMKQIENLIRKSMAADIKIRMADMELSGLIVSRELVLEILNELTKVKSEHECTSSCGKDMELVEAHLEDQEFTEGEQRMDEEEEADLAEINKHEAELEAHDMDAPPENIN